MDSMNGGKFMNEAAIRLARLLDKWADSNGVQFHYRETLRGVSRDDLLTLIEAVEVDTRERIASMIEGKPFKDGANDARIGPCGIGTWHESSLMGLTMRELARRIRRMSIRGDSLNGE
jgi:hypothetical protein